MKHLNMDAWLRIIAIITIMLLSIYFAVILKNMITGNNQWPKDKVINIKLPDDCKGYGVEQLDEYLYSVGSPVKNNAQPVERNAIAA